MSTAPPAVIVIDEASREMRRRLGPASWVLFEELLLAATPVGDRWQASVSVRVLRWHPRILLRHQLFLVL